MNCFSTKSVTYNIYDELVETDERGKGNTFGGIFISYGELHNNYQHS